MSVSLRCFACGHENDPAARFCGNCGLLLRAEEFIEEMHEPETRACLRCKAENPIDAAYCGDCGASLRGVDPPSAVLSTRSAASVPEVQPATTESPAPAAAQVAEAPASSASQAVIETTTDALPPAGTSLTVRCRHCGHENPPDALFCANCGLQHSTPFRPDQPTRLAVELETALEYAGFWRRAAAWVMDTAILWIGLVILYSPMVDAALAVGGVLRVRGALLELLIDSPYFLLALYGILFIAFRGQTPGKMLLHVRVVDKDGHAPGLWRAALRETLGKWVSGLVIGIGFVTVIWDKDNKDKRGWHDIIAGTYVIKV